MHYILKIKSFIKSHLTRLKPPSIFHPHRKIQNKLFKIKPLLLLILTVFLEINKNFLWIRTYLISKLLIIIKCQIMYHSNYYENPYKPSFYLFSSFLQPIYALYLQPFNHPKYTQQTIQQTKIYYMPLHHKITKNINNIPCIIVISSSQGLNSLMSNIMLTINSNKFTTIGIKIKDLHDPVKLIKIVNKIKKQRPNQQFYAVGLQYGANLLVIACALDQNLFRSILSIGNPLNLQLAQKKVQNSIIANFTFLPKIISSRIQQSKLPISTTTALYDLDKLMYNLKTQQQVKKFKQQHSSINYLDKLSIPALFLQSCQDSFCLPFQTLQNTKQLKQKLQQNRLCIFMQTKKGGHNQWFQHKRKRWTPSFIVEHFKNVDKILKQQPNILKKI